jgi:hypothetical protein
MSRSESRKRTKNVPVRWTPEELDEVLEKAALANATFAEFVRASALGKRVVGKNDRQLVNELRRLGGLQKHLAQQSGGRVGPWAREYATLLREIYEAIKRLGSEHAA